ncbi:MAG: hypothetical protein ACYTGB_08745, partial [Planctomycetota bacterium]
MRAGLLIFAAVILLGRAGGGEGAPEFTAGPAAKAEEGGVRVEFAVSRATDVAVEVLNAKGETVRHLAAGVLGENAPEPLVRGLTQALLWDRKDDLGRPVPAGKYSVRVGLGLAPRLKRVENFHPLSFGAAVGVTSMPEGGVCAYGQGPYSDFLARLVAVDREGACVRQLFPPPAGLDPEKCRGVPGFRRGDGRWVPMLKGVMHNAGRGKWPTAMCRRGKVAYACPFGAAGIWPVDVATGAVAKPIGTESLGTGKGRIAVRSMAAGADGKWFYLTGVEMHPKKPKEAKALHAVYRIPASGGAAQVFVGKAGESGKGDALLDAPAGLAVDAKGSLYVCDSGNDRVAVFGPDGKLLRQMKVKAPLLVRVHPRDGRVFALCGAKPAGAAAGFPLAGARLADLGADGKVKGSAELAVPGRLKGACVTGIALDASREPAVTWLSVAGQMYPTTGGALYRFECRADGPAALDPISTNYRKPQGKGPYDPRYQYNWSGSYMDWNEAYDWNYLTDEGTPFCSKLPLTRKPGLWPDGRRYAWKNNNSTWYKVRDKWKSDVGLRRLNAKGEPLPFSSLGTNELKLVHEPKSPWFAQRGVMVDRRGHVYLRY